MQGSLAKPKKMWYTERATAECEIRPCVCRCMVCMVCMRLKNGSCAIRPREPCQVGNQAALSGSSDVPQPACFEYMQQHIFPCGTYGLILCFAVSLCRRGPRRCTKRYTGNTALPFFRMWWGRSKSPRFCVTRLWRGGQATPTCSAGAEEPARPPVPKFSPKR